MATFRMIYVPMKKPRSAERTPELLHEMWKRSPNFKLGLTGSDALPFPTHCVLRPVAPRTPRPTPPS